MTLSIILPCYNDEESLNALIPRLREIEPDAEIIVVDDGSTPPIKPIIGVRIARHVYNMGNGAAIKTGIRNATGELLLFMDSDGQHNPDDIPRLMTQIDAGYDMVVGARSMQSQASVVRRVGNTVYNRLASLMTGYSIQDLTCGFRVARAPLVRRFTYLLPNGFSYPTTLTMAFFRSGLSVGYVPIVAEQRTGQSSIRLARDGVRFLVIILKIGALFSPMRFFLPLGIALFTIATSYYAYTYLSAGRFTNMGAVLYLSSLFVFCFGLVSEQISALHYRTSEFDIDRDTSEVKRNRGE